MGYAVFHASKGKGSGGGLGNHIDRVKGKEHTYKHSDLSRRDLNISYGVSEGREKMPLNKAIADRIEKGYKGKRKIRNDAVKYLTHVYTGSHEDMKKIFSDPKKRKDWIQANADFLVKEFGAKNIVRFSLHLDEKTPHLHAVTVPLTEDGRLSAREIMGNKKSMQERQDRYAEMMKPFGLQRGIRGTGIKHENANDYYKRIDKSIKSSEEAILEPVKSILGINKDKTLEKYKEALKSSKMALDDLNEKSKKDKIRNASLQKSIEREKQNVLIEKEGFRILGLDHDKKVKEKNQELKQLQKIIMTPGKSEELRNRIKESQEEERKLEQEKEVKRNRKRGRSM